MSSRIAIVGVGEVGASTAFGIILDSLCDELLLVDTDVDKRDGHAQDLMDAAACWNSRTRICTASFREAAQCDIITITIGTKHRIGESKLQSNWRVGANLRHAISGMRPFNPNAIIIVVSHPVDTLTALTQELSGLPRVQVFGIGTLLETVQLRSLSSRRFDLWTDCIDINVLAENSSNNQVIAWSTATIGGSPIQDMLPQDRLDLAELARTVRVQGRTTVMRKGAISFSIACVVLGLCRTILQDKQETSLVSHFRPDLGFCISTTAVLGRSGIVEMLPISLSTTEMAEFVAAAEALKGEQMEDT